MTINKNNLTALLQFIKTTAQQEIDKTDDEKEEYYYMGQRHAVIQILNAIEHSKDLLQGGNE